MKSDIKTLKPLKVMFADFAYYNRYTKTQLYTPLGIGFIAQYAKQKFGNEIEVSLFKEINKFFDSVKEGAPDVVGLSLYYWNNSINQYVVKKLRKMFGNKVTIIIGGPSIDSDINQQKIFFKESFPEIDGIVINEGEIAFSNALEKILSDKKKAFLDPIDGLSFLKENEIISGKPIGTSTDISKLGSPYLSGLMDDFMHSEYQPLIQTSRFCPYTCAFCVSGKNRGKLRGFPIEQVKEELNYVSKKYRDRPHHLMYLADENFGILKRDVEIAEAIKECNLKFKYPESVFFYNDKRFTETSRKVIEILGKMTKTGMTLSLQTENPEALKAINRRNVTDEEIDNAIMWANKLNIPTTTELIFGLPYETKESFIDILKRSITRGFDSILAHNLFIMDGIELNRPQIREKYGLKTKFRPLSSSYMTVDNKFIAEHEEVVVSTKTFNYDDYLEVRKLNFMFFAIFTLNFQKWFFQFIKFNKKISLPEILTAFMKPDMSLEWPDDYIKFVNDFTNAAKSELFDTKEEMIRHLRKIYEENNNDVAEPTRINVTFVARLIYQENHWVKEVLLKHYKNIMEKEILEEDFESASSLIDLAILERIDLKEKRRKSNLDYIVSFDINKWKKDKFKKPLYDYKMPKKNVNFVIDNNRSNQINGLKRHSKDLLDKDFYINAIDFINPRSNLLHILDY
tara:strand:+ start:1264 stop:3312 length:2049 start_codon:yes stop_codon:yes gene_type:complete